MRKTRTTGRLAVTANGQKLTPNIILWCKTLPKEKLPSGVIFHVLEKGWMNEELVLDCLNVVWGRRLGALLHQRGMLLLDMAKGRLTENVKKRIAEIHMDLVVILGGMTSQ